MTKDFTNTRVKSVNEAAGTATVVFATLETIDKDNDWIQRGAVGSQTAKVAAAHKQREPPIGFARIREVDNEALADIRFNLDMESAQAWYQSIKFNYEHGIPQEYSFGFLVRDEEMGTRNNRKVRVLKRLEIFEVSPVLLGAGINTRTVDIKECRSCSEKSAARTLSDHSREVLAEVQTFVARVKSVSSLRAADGRVISQSLADDVAALQRELSAILKASGRDQDVEGIRLHSEYLRLRTLSSDARFIRHG